MGCSSSSITKIGRRILFLNNLLNFSCLSEENSGNEKTIAQNTSTADGKSVAPTLEKSNETKEEFKANDMEEQMEIGAKEKASEDVVLLGEFLHRSPSGKPAQKIQFPHI